MHNFLLFIAGLIFIANFFILIAYGDTLQSTHLFIVRGTIFYPVAFVNLIAGISLSSYAIYRWFSQKRPSI